jgi:hypothetical protein
VCVARRAGVSALIMVVDYGPIESPHGQGQTEKPFADERCRALVPGDCRIRVTGPTSAARWCGYRGKSCSATPRSRTTCGTIDSSKPPAVAHQQRRQVGTFVAIYMHDNRLACPGTTAGDPPPGFQQSLGFVDKDGNGVRYRLLRQRPPRSRACGRSSAGPAPAPAK